VQRNLDWLKARHPQRISSVVADVRDADALAQAAADASAVLHLAAQVAVTTSMVEPMEDFDINMRGTLTLLEALRRRNDRTPLLFASTNKVYGGLEDLEFDLEGEAYVPRDPTVRARGVGEDRSLDFHTPYGCSKGAADQYVLDYARSFGVPTAVMRMSCIYGPRQMGTEDQGWVAHFLIRALEGRPISIFGDGYQVRDILDVSDAVDAWTAAFARIDQVSGRAFNLGGGPGNAVSLRQVLKEIDGGRRRLQLDLLRLAAGRSALLVSDTAGAERAGLPPRPWREGCRRWRLAAGERRSRAAARGGAWLKPAHVFMTADAVGGVWPYALDLGAGWPARVRTTLAVSGPRARPGAAQGRGRRSGAAPHPCRPPLEWLALSGAVVEAAGAAVSGHGNNSGADLVHLNTPALGSEGGFRAPVVAAAHSDVATWWAAVKGGSMPDDFAWRTALVKRGYDHAQAVIAPTAAFAEATRKAYALPATPLTVHNGRFPLDGPPGPQLTDCVFTAGRLWDEGKGMAVLDRAAGRIATLVCAAGPLSGPHGQSIRLEFIRALGRVDEAEIGRRLHARPVFVSPSLYEPFGLAVLEAAQSGCPLVLSDIETFRELWGGAAVFTPPGDGDALADALQSLMLDAELRRELGAAALERAGRYTVEATVGRMLAIYADVLASGRGADARDEAA
jgi:CDP-paratose 2-epimerase